MALQGVAGDRVTVSAPNFKTAVFRIRGTAPLVMHKFSQKARAGMLAKQLEGGTAASKRTKHDPRKPEEEYEAAKHVSKDGWIGLPAAGFRAAMVSACRLVGFKMTHAKLSFFVQADGFDADDGTPLVKIVKGEPRMVEHVGRLETGVACVIFRPMWDEWEANLTIRFDADQFSLTDIANLLSRVGMQVGICEGRPDSKKSVGMGWGTFEIVGDAGALEMAA